MADRHSVVFRSIRAFAARGRVLSKHRRSIADANPATAHIEIAHAGLPVADTTSGLHPQPVAHSFKHHGNRIGAAEELGVSRTTLWRWVKQAGLENVM